jgi:hypothetical protein
MMVKGLGEGRFVSADSKRVIGRRKRNREGVTS